MVEKPFSYGELGITIEPSAGRDTTGDRLTVDCGGALSPIENDLRYQPESIETLSTTLGIKKSGKIDFTVMRLAKPGSAAGVFTRSLCPSVTILRARKILAGGTLQAIAVNSGNANVFTSTGERDVERTAELLSHELGVPSGQILVCSTGVIGVPLPMERFESGIPGIAAKLKRRNLEAAAEAILTTDAGPKTASFRSGDLVICGIAKGAGMIQPNLATMLVYFFTNAALSSRELQEDLESAVESSFNRISIDSDTSTSDAVALLTTGETSLAEDQRDVFRRALTAIAVKLSRDIVSQGEGVSKIIETTVSTDVSAAFALDAAKQVINSPLLKAAVHGADPNWGRVVAALGKADNKVPLNPAAMRISLMDTAVYDRGRELNADLKAVSAAMKVSRRIPIDIAIGEPKFFARTWGADLTEDYVRFNSEYTS